MNNNEEQSQQKQSQCIEEDLKRLVEVYENHKYFNESIMKAQSIYVEVPIKKDWAIVTEGTGN